MTSILLYGSQISLVALLALMLYRVKNLYMNAYPVSANDESLEPISFLDRMLKISASDNNEYERKMECLKQAQIFSGVQMLEIRRNYPQLNQENMRWLREAISLYLIGAVDFIGKESRCKPSTRKELISLILKSNLKLSDAHASRYFEEALYRKMSSENDLMVRAGAKAAKSWMIEKQVPNNLSLNFQLNDWGVFA